MHYVYMTFTCHRHIWLSRVTSDMWVNEKNLLQYFETLIIITVYFRPKIRNSFNMLLIALAIFDTLYSVASFLETVRKSFRMASRIQGRNSTNMNNLRTPNSNLYPCIIINHSQANTQCMITLQYNF
jgi:hypothetical protein